MIAARVLLAIGLIGCGPSVVGTTPGGASVVKIPLRLSNVYLIETRPPILVDSGTIGDAHDLNVALSDRGTSFRRIGLVVLTHAHADHAGLAAELQSYGASIAVGAGDLERSRRGVNDELKPTSFTASLIKPLIVGIFPELEPDRVIAQEPLDLVPFGVEGRVLSMPGHTAGSLAVVLANGDAFVGDMMRGDAFGNPVDHYYHADREQNRANIQTLIAMGVRTFYLGHGGPVQRADVISAFNLKEN